MNIIENYVYTVYNCGSFSKAAEKLFISQPALSKAVSKHELNLGYKIFDRKHRLNLTS